MPRLRSVPAAGSREVAAALGFGGFGTTAAPVRAECVDSAPTRGVPPLMTSHDPVAASLLVHAPFVRRLAHALAGADGDDLAQETYMTALQAGHGEVNSVRGWLATIAANLARNLTRAENRRRRREANAGAARDAVPAVAEIVAREEARRHVVDAVLALPDPLRAVVLLRFFGGLDSRAIGQRLAMPASTVRTNLQRALAALRRRLDRDHGDLRAAWTAPLLAGTGRSPVMTLGMLLRTSWPLRSALGVAALVLVGWFVVGRLTAPPNPPHGAPVEVASGVQRDADAPMARAAAPSRDVVAIVPAADERGPEHLWGRVVDAATGAPVTGAEVVLEHRDADEMTSLDLAYNERAETVGTALTDRDGGFAFHVRRALQHRIAVRAAGYAPLCAAMCTGGSEFVLRLERPATVAGVVRAADGTPLADVVVATFVRGGNGDRTTTRTAGDGTFALGDLPPAVSYVVALPAGRTGSAWQQVTLEPGRRTHVEITIDAGRTVRGAVRDAETGIPIAGATISTSWTMRPGVTTAADGRYELGGLGRRATLHVRAEGYADQVRDAPPQDGPLTADFALERGDTIVGRVVDETGSGIAAAYVAAAAQQWDAAGGMDTFWRSGAVDDRGNFRIDHLGRDARSQPRGWQLLVRAPGMGSRVLAMPFRRLADGVLDIGDVRLAPQAILEGRVVDGDGRPVVGADVTLQGTPDDALAVAPEWQEFRPVYHFGTRDTRSAGDGTYRIAGLAAGSYTVHARPRGVSWQLDSEEQAVAAGALVTVSDLVADAGLTITGRVRLPGARQLPADTTIVIWAFGPTPDTPSAEVAADGTFTVERLQPGDYTLATLDAPPGFALAPRAGVAAGRQDVEVELVPSTTIEGSVVDADDQPIRGAPVWFFPQGVTTSRNSFTDAAGRFRIELAPGVVGQLGARHPDREMDQAHRPDVVAGTVDLVLKLPKRGK